MVVDERECFKEAGVTLVTRRKSHNFICFGGVVVSSSSSGRNNFAKYVLGSLKFESTLFSYFGDQRPFQLKAREDESVLNRYLG